MSVTLDKMSSFFSQASKGVSETTGKLSEKPRSWLGRVLTTPRAHKVFGYGMLAMAGLCLFAIIPERVFWIPLTATALFFAGSATSHFAEAKRTAPQPKQQTKTPKP